MQCTQNNGLNFIKSSTWLESFFVEHNYKTARRFNLPRTPFECYLQFLKIKWIFSVFREISLNIMDSQHKVDSIYFFPIYFSKLPCLVNYSTRVEQNVSAFHNYNWVMYKLYRSVFFGNSSRFFFNGIQRLCCGSITLCSGFNL